MENIINESRTRRDFLKGAGAVVAGGVVVGVVGSQLACEQLPGVADWWTADSSGLSLAPNAEGYLMHDTQKCAHCLTCMMTCSAAHEGVNNPSLSRRQVSANPFGQFPVDVSIMDCRQCVYPACVEACPSGAFHTDPDNGNTRTVNEGACADYQASISPDVCELCVQACPYIPSVAIWKPVSGQAGVTGVAMVCDLCNDAPYWSKTGGVNGDQACVDNCPMRAIKLVKVVPSQLDTEGYDVNLRTSAWREVLVW